MKIERSTIEQLAWYVVVLVLVAAIAVGLILFNLSRKIDSRTEDIQNQMTCIGLYFTQTDRANLKIPSLDKCNIQRVR